MRIIVSKNSNTDTTDTYGHDGFIWSYPLVSVRVRVATRAALVATVSKISCFRVSVRALSMNGRNVNFDV